MTCHFALDLLCAEMHTAFEREEFLNDPVGDPGC